jgi:DNA-binding MarR family transcriptional regulator
MRAKPLNSLPPDNSAFLSGFLGTHIRVAHMAAILTLERAFAPLKMSPTRYAILVHAQELPGATQTQLAELVGADRTTIVPMLASLERQGLIRRARAVHDRRSTEICITGKGRGLLKKLIPLAVAHNRRMTLRVSAAEQAALKRTLERIRRNLIED